MIGIDSFLLDRSNLEILPFGLCLLKKGRKLGHIVRGVYAHRKGDCLIFYQHISKEEIVNFTAIYLMNYLAHTFIFLIGIGWTKRMLFILEVLY